MMINFIKESKFRLGGILLIISVIVGIINFSMAKAEGPSFIVIDENINKEFINNEFVSYIINLKEEADLEKAIENANTIASRTKATPSKQKALQRNFVVSQLQSTAETSQEDILGFLKTQKELGNVEKINSFYILNSIVITSNKEVFDELTKSNIIKKIFLNEEISIDFNDSESNNTNEGNDTKDDNIINSDENILWNLEHIKANSAWEQGYFGNGITVAVIDTGVDGNHPALKNNWRGHNNPSPYGHWYDVQDKNSLFPSDDVGHGTHVMGIITGFDEENNITTGVAPKANWIGVKAFDGDNTTTEFLLDAAQWILAPLDENAMPQPDLAPDIVNGSWTSKSEGINEVFFDIIEKWRSANIIPIFAVGNTQYQGQSAMEGSVSAPANYKNVFSVGSIDENNNLEEYSLRGPSPYGEIKPEISAPGNNILSAKSGGGYIEKAGSSMAAPHVSGAIALLLEINPVLKVHEIENILINNTDKLTNTQYQTSPNNGFGFGMLNIEKILDEVLNMDYGIISGHIEVEGIDSVSPKIHLNHVEKIIKLENSYMKFNVSDDNGVKEVVLKFRDEENEAWDYEEKLNLSSGTYLEGEYDFLIPNEVFEMGKVEYQLDAYDIQDNKTQSPINEINFTNGVESGYVQDFESNINDFRFYNKDNIAWEWGKPSSNPKANSGSNLVSTSLGDNYMGLSYAKMQLPIFDLTNITSSDNPFLLFANWYEFYYKDNNIFDEGHVYIATLNKDNIVEEDKELVASFKNEKEYWSFSGIDLSKWAGKRIAIQFVLTSNSERYQTESGWYVDDIKFTTKDTKNLNNHDYDITQNINNDNSVEEDEINISKENSFIDTKENNETESNNKKTSDDEEENNNDNTNSNDEPNNIIKLQNQVTVENISDNEINIPKENSFIDTKENNETEFDNKKTSDDEEENNNDNTSSNDEPNNINNNKFIINKAGTNIKSSGNTLPIMATITVKETKMSTVTEIGTGFYSLKHPAGNYTLIIESEGFKSQEVFVQFEKDTTKSIDVILSSESTGILKGFVKDKGNMPIENARVRLLNDANIPPAFTNSNGEFKFSNVSPDMYVVKVTHNGYKSLEQDNVNVNTGSTTDTGILILKKHLVGTETELIYDNNKLSSSIGMNEVHMAVKMSVDKKSILSGARFLFHNDDINLEKESFKYILFKENNEDGTIGEVIYGPEEGVATVNGDWTYVTFPNIKVKDDFYIAYYQDNSTSSLKLGTDNNPNSRSVYLDNNKWEEYSIGSFMIRGYINELNEDIIINKLETNKSQLNLEVDETFDLNIWGYDTDNFKYNLMEESSFISSDSKVVSINKKGKITGVGKGSAYINIIYINKDSSVVKFKLDIVVNHKDNPDEVNKIYSDKINITIKKDNTDKITIKSINKNNVEEDITNKTDYVFSNGNIISIDKKGNITGLELGETSVIGKYKDPLTNTTHETIFNVKVNENIESIKSSLDKISIELGETSNVIIYSVDSNGKKTDITKKIKFDYKEKNIIEINIRGEVTTKKVGSTIVTAEYIDLDLKPYLTTFIVEVFPTKQVSEIEEIIPSDTNVTLELYETTKIQVKSVDKNNFEKDITQEVIYTVSDGSICEINQAGFISPLLEGRATINIVYEDEGTKFHSSISIEIVDNSFKQLIPSLKNINLEVDEIETIVINAVNNKGKQLNITDLVSFKLSKDSIIDINKSGVITALDEGEVEIYFEYKDPISKDILKTNVNVTVVNKPIINSIVNIKPSINKIEMEKNDFKSINIKSFDNNNIEKDITNDVLFQDYDSNMISISQSGIIASSDIGETGIKVLYEDTNGISHTTNINVIVTKNSIESIYSSKTNFSLEVDEEDYLSIFSINSKQIEEDITSLSSFIHSNPGVAHISSSGKITGIKEGTTLINVNYKDPVTKKDFNTTLNIVVTKKDLTSEVVEIKPNVDEIELIENESSFITIYSIDNNNTKNDITSLVSFDIVDINIASIQQDGSITGIKKGSTKVIATYKENNTNKTFTTDFIITVSKTQNTSSIKKIQPQDENISLKIGENKKIKIYGIDNLGNKEDITNDVTFVVNNKVVCSLIGSNVKGISQGISRITVKYIHNTEVFETTINITVSKDTTNSISKIVPSENKLSLYKNSSKKIEIYSVDENNNRTNITTDVIFSSNNGNIALINKNGLISGFSKGNTIIIGKYYIDGKTYECEINITVQEKDSIFETKYIYIDSNNSHIGINQISYLQIKAIDKNNKNKLVTNNSIFKTSNSNIVTVTNSGRIEGLKEGIANIEVSYYDPNSNRSFYDDISLIVSNNTTGNNNNNGSSNNGVSSNQGSGNNNNSNNESNKDNYPAIDNNKDSSNIEINLIKDKSLKYLSGYEEENEGLYFKPNNEITRAEFAQVIYTLLDIKNKDNIDFDLPFTDVSVDAWFYNQIKLLTKNNLLSGYEDNTLKPNNPMTRGEAVTVLAHFVDDNYASKETNSFSDINNHWAYKSIITLSSRGHIKGYEDGSFNPNGLITRAELVIVINSVLERVPLKGQYTSKDNIYIDLDKSFWAYDNIISASKR